MQSIDSTRSTPKYQFDSTQLSASSIDSIDRLDQFRGIVHFCGVHLSGFTCPGVHLSGRVHLCGVHSEIQYGDSKTGNIHNSACRQVIKEILKVARMFSGSGMSTVLLAISTSVTRSRISNMVGPKKCRLTYSLLSCVMNYDVVSTNLSLGQGTMNSTESKTPSTA